MKFLKPAILAVLGIGLCIALNSKLGPVPPLGKFLNPATGFWQNAESDKLYTGSTELNIKGLKGKVTIFYDDRLVPHIFAENDDDLYFAQGYVTASLRLWQMEMQTYAAAGRVSEIIGEKALNYDRENRRQGLLFGAENAVKEIEKDPEAKRIADTYTAGVNAYIESLDAASIPMEYKLMDFKPEKWTVLKTALLLKYMADFLTGSDDDFAMTNALKMFSKEELALLFPNYPDSLQSPIIPQGTAYNFAPEKIDTTGIAPLQSTIPKEYAQLHKKDPDWGSNNWAVSGSKTKSGAPILCNDPHLELNLPAIWFECQLVSPNQNVYGATLPGAPGIIVGFNKDIAWGVTNAGRDVRDWYAIKFKDATRKEYWFDGQWKPTTFRVEEIKVRGGKTLMDTIVYTQHGPVVYDKNYGSYKEQFNMALTWTAHQGSNEARTFLKLNTAKNYDDYRDAIKTFVCPGQNFVFASRSGDVAITQQGKFVNLWNEQGKFVMDGTTSKTLWNGYIPAEHNATIKNPERGFVSSANQHPTDAAYPYYYWGGFEYYRNRRLNNRLAEMNGITIADMQGLQNDNFNQKAADALPLWLKLIDRTKLTKDQAALVAELDKWDYVNSPDSKAASTFEVWQDAVYKNVWDEFTSDKIILEPPTTFQTIRLMHTHPTLTFYDSKTTPNKVETLTDMVLLSFTQAADSIAKWGKKNNGKPALWADFKATSIEHLTKQKAFGYYNIQNGGNRGILNATSARNGPSWRMVVQLSSTIEAYGIYPGGQSGNPGSKYYGNMVADWTQGKYYRLNFYDAPPAQALYTQSLTPAK